MFVLLEHVAGASSESGGAASRHWDLLIEAAGQDLIPTWRLSANPLEVGGDIPAERIKDHRRLYLSYEGPLSGGRGTVRRLDSGPAEVRSLEGAELRVELAGTHLTGTYAVALNPHGRLVLLRGERTASR